MFRRDPSGELGLLVPVRVAECDPPELNEREKSPVAATFSTRLRRVRSSGCRYFSCRTDSRLPDGSLNQAMYGPSARKTPLSSWSMLS